MMNLKKNIQKYKRLNEVAMHLGISASALTQSLNSENMSMSRLIAIAEFCECSIDKLVYGEELKQDNTGLTCPHCGKQLNVTIN